MAQIASNRLTPQVESVDSGVEAGLGFPATAAWVRFVGADQNGTSRMFHLITGTGAPSTNFNNADNGSLYIDYTNFKLYIKTAAATWIVVGTQT